MLSIWKLSPGIKSTPWSSSWLSSLLVLNTVHSTRIILTWLTYSYSSLISNLMSLIIGSGSTLTLISFIWILNFILYLLYLLKISTIIETNYIWNLVNKIDVCSRLIFRTLRMRWLLLILNNWTSTTKYTSLYRKNSWNILWTLLLVLRS